VGEDQNDEVEGKKMLCCASKASTPSISLFRIQHGGWQAENQQFGTQSSYVSSY
jgi:hypothetical protein